MYDVTVNDQEARKERIVLANRPSWRLAHSPTLDDHGNVVVEVLEFDSSWNSRFCRMEGCNCTGGRWANRDALAASMILVSFVFKLMTGRELLGVYIKTHLKTAHRDRSQDLFVTDIVKSSEDNDDDGSSKSFEKSFEKWSYRGRVREWNRTMYGASDKNFKKAFSAWLWWVVHLQERGCRLQPRSIIVDAHGKRQAVTTHSFPKSFRVERDMPKRFPCECGPDGCEKPVKL
jgi:hypothetical protein